MAFKIHTYFIAKTGGFVKRFIEDGGIAREQVLSDQYGTGGRDIRQSGL
jgi:hypothetical protein